MSTTRKVLWIVAIVFTTLFVTLLFLAVWIPGEPRIGQSATLTAIIAGVGYAILGLTYYNEMSDQDEY